MWASELRQLHMITRPATPRLHVAGVLLLTPFEARAVSWSMGDVDAHSGGAAGTTGSAVRALSLRLLARWRLDAGDPGKREK